MDDLPEVQVSSESNSRCHVSRKLLPIKGFYFVFLSGMVPNLRPWQSLKIFISVGLIGYSIIVDNVAIEAGFPQGKESEFSV